MKLKFCVLCGTKEKLHHHHVIPKAQGGTDDEDNFMTPYEECIQEAYDTYPNDPEARAEAERWCEENYPMYEPPEEQ